MQEIEVTAKLPKDDKEATIKVNMPADFDEAGAYFGKKEFFEKGMSKIIVDIQGAMRRGLAAGSSQAELQDSLRDYKPGVRVAAPKDLMAAFMSKWQNMTDEERKATLQALKGAK